MIDDDIPPIEDEKKGDPNYHKRYEGFQFTDEQIREVGILAGRGLTQAMIAAYFGISNSCFKNKKRENETLRMAAYQGKAKATAMVSGKLMELIKAGNITAIIFYLRTQGRWKEATEDQKEESEEDNQPKKVELGTRDPIEASKAYQQIMLGESDE